jgi:hypothetical protein
MNAMAPADDEALAAAAAAAAANVIVADERTRVDIARGVDCVRKILAATDEEFADRKWMLQRVREYGLAHRNWPEFSRYTTWKNASEFGLLQLPTEFVDFAMYVSAIGIKTAVEIGVWTGSSSYFLAAVLTRADPALVYHMVDIQNYVLGFDEFSRLLNLHLHIPGTSADLVGQEFDLVFIDGDHSYDGALADYANLGRYCRRAVAFHDIRAVSYDALNGGTVRMWREFRDSAVQDMRILQFTHDPQPWMGIGLGVRA